VFRLKINRRRDFRAPTSSLAQRIRRLTPLERTEEARAFLAQFCRELGHDQAFLRRRWGTISAELKRHRYYEHTAEELTFGARVAWRNHSRCIGRLYWESLEVSDCRTLVEPDAIAHRAAQHLDEAFNDGKIRSLISVFSPIRGDQFPAYIESRQLTQYAGYSDHRTGRVIGDRQNVELTRIAQSLGHVPPDERSNFDILPIVMRDQQDRRLIRMLPATAHREVSIRHPESDGFNRLGLRWYAVPCISGMILTIGGMDYPCAPFNGFYMVTEIGSRDLADTMRYDLLPQVSRALGDVPDSHGTLLWQDRALTELNRAVLHSYRQAGVMLLDHHSASEHFRRFCQREHGAGRHVSADWSWIVPPHASSSCEVFHMPMQELSAVPNYYWNHASDGLPLMPYYGDLERGRWTRRLDHWKRRWKLWSRKP
jgi:nitric-oxide synthase, bacterial